MNSDTPNPPSGINLAATPPLVKRQGPIRTGAVVPALILLIICFIFFRFFFDWSMKRTLTFTGTHFYGAEVDIASLHTSFLHGSIQIRGIELTDKRNPSLDFLRIGEVHFRFLWDALLRAKFVVNNAGIDGIELYPPRRQIGWVKPNVGQSLIGQSVTEQIKNLSPGDTLSGLAGLLQGTNQEDLVKAMQGGLKSKAQITQLQTELAQKQKEWQKRIAQLPQKKDFQNLINRAKALKFNTNNPQQFAQNLQKAVEIKKELDQELRSVKSTTDALNTDVRNLSAQYKGIDRLAKQDVANAEAGLHLGNLDSKTLTQTLFMNMLAEKLGAYAKYIVLARRYMASPSSNNGEKSASTSTAFTPHVRDKGRTFRFPVTTGYPLFWLRRADISSKTTSSGFSGNIAGSLTNVTTDPAIVGQPAVLDIKGDFPNANVYKIHLNLTFDHVHTPVDTMDLSAGSYPVLGMRLIASKNLRLGLQKASGQSLVHASYQDKNLTFQTSSTFNDVTYAVQSPSTQMKQILTQILAGIPIVTLNTLVSGSLPGRHENAHLDVSMNSNLGAELAAGLQKYVQAQLNDLRAKIQTAVESQIAGPKKQLGQQLNAANGQLNQLLGSKNKEASATQNTVTNQTTGRGSQLNDATKQLQNAAQKLLKGLHF